MGQSESSESALFCPRCSKPDKPYQNVYPRMNGTFRCRKCNGIYQIPEGHDTSDSGTGTDEEQKVSGGNKR